MKKIVKPHKARKTSASTDVPSFARGKDQILKSPARLQRRKKNELGEFDTGKDDSIIKNTIAYNQWRQSLPNNLRNETPDYDLYGAFKAGLQPEWNDEDKSYHLGSRDPKTGRILKKPGHPTFGYAIYNDMRLGYYPIYKDGDIYTVNPFKYNKGKDQIQKEQGKFDKGKEDIVFKEIPNWQYADDGSGNMNIVDTNTGQTGTFALPELEVVGNKPTIWDKVKNWFTNATIGAAMAEDPSVMTASGWKQNSNGDWIQSPDEGSKQLADNLAVISSFSPTNYATAVGDALISKVGYPLYQLVKNKQLLPYIKSYLTHPTWQTYYHGSPISFNVNEAKMGTPADMGLHVTRNKDVTNNFGGISYKMRAPRPKVTTSDLWQNGMEHLRKDHVFFKPSAYSHTDFNIADKQLLDDLNKSGIEFKLENPHYIGSPDYRRLTGNVGQEFRINPRSRFEKAIPKSKRAQFNEEADKLVNIPNNIDIDSPAEILRKSALNEASAKLLDKYGLTTVKYFNRNPYEGLLPAYWINNPNKIDVLYNYNTMNTIHGLSSPITTIAADQSLYDKGKDDHKYFDYIIAQSMLGNPTAKRMTGEDNRYIPAFGQGDRSNIVLGSFGNYATPSVMNIGGELMYTPNPWEVFPEWMVQNQSFRFNNPNDAIDFAESYKYSSPAFTEFFGVDSSVNYNKGKDSGIHIKKKNRGKFTALKKRTGKSASWFKEHGTPAQKKMAIFALNARKWKH